MRNACATAVLAAVLLSACSSETAEKKERTESLRDFVASVEGKRKLEATKARAGAKLPAQPGQLSALMWSKLEGRWTSGQAAPPTIVVAFDRNGTAVAEVIDGAGRTIETATGTVTLNGTSVSGSLRPSGKRLAPYARWTLTPQGGLTNATLTGAGEKKLLTKMPPRAS